MEYLKDVKCRVAVRQFKDDPDSFVQLTYNYAALDVRRLQQARPPCFLLAHAIIEPEMTIILEWCTWPTLLQYAGAYVTLGRVIHPPIIQLVTWELLRATHYLNQVLGGPHCNITMETVLIYNNNNTQQQPQIKITSLEEAGHMESNQWRRGALAYRPPEKLFGTAETYDEMVDPIQDTHDLFSIGICLATLSLAGHPLDEDVPLLARGERYNPQCTQHGSTIFDLLRKDHQDIRPHPPQRTPEFEHFVRVAVFMQALGNGIVPGGSDDPSLCFAVWPEFAQLPEVLAFLSLVRAQRYGGSREARVICDALHRDHNRMGVIRALMQWLPRKRQRDVDPALRRWGFRNHSLSTLPIVQYDNAQSDITRFPSSASFYTEMIEAGICSICGHMARFRCQKCPRIGGTVRLYCSKECSLLDGEHRSLCQ